MSSMSNKNSAAAQDYAEKKKAALQNANRLAAERKRKQELQDAATNADNTSLDLYQPAAPRKMLGSAGGVEVESVFSNDFAERLVIRSGKQTGLDTTQRNIEPMQKVKNTSFIVGGELSSSSMRRNQQKPSSGATPPSLMEAALPKPDSRITSTIRATIDGTLTIPQTSHFVSNCDSIYLSPPRNSSGELVSVSDLPILCSCPISSANGNGVAVGGADHRAYVIITAKNQKPRVTPLGGRTDGHSDWITGVGVLNDFGIVATTAMDGKLCLWSLGNSSSRGRAAPIRCQEVSAHRGSISKLLVDTTAAKCVTFGYDGFTHLWDVSNSSTGSSRRSSLSPLLSLQGRGPTIEGYYTENTLLTGDRSGGLMVYDVSSGAVVVKYPAHKGAITGIVAADTSGQNKIYATGGGDGFVKVWDTRVKQVAASLPLATSPPTASSSGITATIAALTSTTVSGGNHLVSSGSDNSVHIVDMRSNSIQARFDHHKVGIYTVASVGTRTLLTADGAGLLCCYDLSTAEMKYGLGASSKGAVRCVSIADNKLYACGEDGNVLIYDF